MANTGWQSAGSASTEMDIGTVDWTDPGNITASDDTAASCSFSASDESYFLVATNFGFAIPAGATIDGMLCRWEGKDGGGAGTVSHSVVNIVKGGTRGSADKSLGASFTATDNEYEFGGVSDLWSETWTASDINASNYGCAMSVVETGGDSETCLMDHCKMIVYYTEPSGFEAPTEMQVSQPYPAGWTASAYLKNRILDWRRRLCGEFVFIEQFDATG